MNIKILDELESQADESLADSVATIWGTAVTELTRRGKLVEKALPALIQVARAAEHFYNVRGALGSRLYWKAEDGLEQALQQVRDLGETNE